MTTTTTNPKQPAAEAIPPFPSDKPDEWVPPPSVAKFLHTSVGTLAYQRSKGYGIPYAKVGVKVLYRVGDVLDYLAARTVDPQARGREAV